MMFEWLMRYATQFGKEFPLHLFADQSEYTIRQMVVDCCSRGEPYSKPAEAEPVEPEPAGQNTGNKSKAK